MIKRQILLATILTLSGCATLLEPAGTETVSYHAGRDITVAYLLGRDNLEDKHIEAIKVVYSSFSEVLDSIEASNVDEFKYILIESLVNNIDNEKVRLLSIHLVNKYWDRLMVKIDWESIRNDEKVKVLLELRRGIEDSLTEYDFLKEN